MINGKKFPKIIISIDGNDTIIDTEIGCITTYEFNVEDAVTYKSVITGKQTQKVKGYYHKFTIDYKIVDQILYNKLVQLTDTGCTITLYPHADSLINYSVFLSKYKPYYLNNLYSCDALMVELVTIDYIAN